AIDDGGIDAETGEDGGKFHRDIAAALDKNGMGQRRQVERLVGGDGQFRAGNGGNEGLRTGGDQNVFRRQVSLLPDEMHAVGAGDEAPIPNDLDARLFEIGRVGAFEPGDFLFLVGDECRPVESGIDLPAEAGGDIEHIVEARGVDIELFGDAAANDAGATDAELLDNGDLGAIGGRHAGGGDAAGAGTNHDEIIAIGHRAAPLQSSVYGDEYRLALRIKKDPAQGGARFLPCRSG